MPPVCTHEHCQQARLYLCAHGGPAWHCLAVNSGSSGCRAAQRHLLPFPQHLPLCTTSCTSRSRWMPHQHPSTDPLPIAWCRYAYDYSPGFVYWNENVFRWGCGADEQARVNFGPDPNGPVDERWTRVSVTCSSERSCSAAYGSCFNTFMDRIRKYPKGVYSPQVGASGVGVDVQPSRGACAAGLGGQRRGSRDLRVAGCQLLHCSGKWQRQSPARVQLCSLPAVPYVQPTPAGLAAGPPCSVGR